MASFTFYGATDDPMDVIVTLENAAGVISVVGSVAHGPNITVIDPLLSGGLLSTRRGRIAGPDQSIRYELGCYCGLVTGVPAQRFLLVQQGARNLKCFDKNGDDLPITAQGVLIGTLANATFFGTDFRVKS